MHSNKAFWLQFAYMEPEYKKPRVQLPRLSPSSYPNCLICWSEMLYPAS